MNPSMRALAIAFVVVVFVCGVFAGIAGDRLLLDAEGGRAQHGPPGPPRHGARPPVERYFDELTAELDLSAPQQQQLTTVLDAAQLRARVILEAQRPALNAAREQTRTEVLGVLTAEQRTRFEALEARRAPPDVGPPNGPPGPDGPHGPPGPRDGPPPPR
jgi:Spy/CpxP family protein refolding chaperone